MNKKILIGIIVIVLIVIFFMLKPGITGKTINENIIKIPLSEISNQAKFYESEGISYFVVKASDGSIKTAFDACDVCYDSKKGYKQEGEFMICNNCGNRYLIIELGTKNKRGGGCWPGYLPSKVEGENLIIKKSDIIKGEYKF